MQDLLPEYTLLTTKMIFSVHLEATIVFSTCELVIMNITIFFGDGFGEDMAELVPTGFLQDFSTK